MCEFSYYAPHREHHEQEWRTCPVLQWICLAFRELGASPAQEVIGGSRNK